MGDKKMSKAEKATGCGCLAFLIPGALLTLVGAPNLGAIIIAAGFLLILIIGSFYYAIVGKHRKRRIAASCLSGLSLMVLVMVAWSYDQYGDGRIGYLLLLAYSLLWGGAASYRFVQHCKELKAGEHYKETLLSQNPGIDLNNLDE
ncbi:MAG: hypothetical protein MJ016_03525 [Victivallaceae bacterium]|nr:hypothetical protein [Victivallaceae bacterium]